MTEWPNGGMPFPKQDIKNPEDFAAMAKLVRPEDFKNRVLMTSDLAAHTAHIQHYVDMGFDEIHLHNVGRNQAEFIEVFGARSCPPSGSADPPVTSAGPDAARNRPTEADALARDAADPLSLLRDRFHLPDGPDGPGGPPAIYLAGQSLGLPAARRAGSR